MCVCVREKACGSEISAKRAREREVGLEGELICRRRSLEIDVGLTDEYGRTALHFAAFMGKVCVRVCVIGTV